MKQAIQPDIKALIEISRISFFRVGTTAVNAPIIIPSATTFENPQRAYVAIISE